MVEAPVERTRHGDAVANGVGPLIVNRSDMCSLDLAGAAAVEEANPGEGTCVVVYFLDSSREYSVTIRPGAAG